MAVHTFNPSTGEKKGSDKVGGARHGGPGEEGATGCGSWFFDVPPGFLLIKII